MTDNYEAGGANPSYKGYEYQKLVTVWVALRLIFGSGACTDQVIVEPASHDDVKANLNVAADAAEAGLSALAGGELHIQIKFKGAGFWSTKDFAGVVEDKAAKGKQGPQPRRRAKAQLLEKSSRRYVFITNTSVDSVLAKGRVRSPEIFADPNFLPTKLKVDATQRKNLAGRFAFIELMTPEETRHQIYQLLHSRPLCVPTQELNTCVKRLKQMVEDRFLEVPDPLRKIDILKIAEGLGGTPHANPQLVHYVPPANRAEAEKRLKTHGAVLLVGPPGYGKSLTADSLVHDRRQENPPFKVVRETAGLALIGDAFAVPGRVLFHLEDPWGQSGLKKDEAAQWTSRLSALILQRAHGKQFVITCRSEIYLAALGDDPAPVWADRCILIDDTSYDMPARHELLHSNLRVAGAWRQDLARQHEAYLLSALKSPFEIIAFTRELIAVSKPVDAEINALVNRALTNSRTHVVMDNVKGFGDRGVAGAAVLWALLRFSRNLSPSRLASLRREVDRARGPDIALDDLAKHLAQTQLTLDQDGAYAAHSKVVEALESLARMYPRTTETALNAAARAAILLTKKDLSWMDELQRLAGGARAQVDTDVVLDDDVVDDLNTLLIAGLAANAVGNPSSFRAAWHAANYGLSRANPIGQLVHWLERGASKQMDGMNLSWLPPKVSKAERQAIALTVAGPQILKGFIAHVLPWRDEIYDADIFLRWLQPFGLDLAESFLSAGEEVIQATQFVMNADAISECALTGPEPPYDKVWGQVLNLDADIFAALTTSREERRQAWQGELDYAEGSAVNENVGEQVPFASHYARGYVRARRRQQGYSWIPTHPRPDIILPLWADLMSTSAPKVTAAELKAFFQIASNNDQLQAKGLQVIGDHQLTFGRDRVFKALTTGGPYATEAAIRALSWLESDSASLGLAVEQTLLDLLQSVSPARAALLATKIANIKHGEEQLSLAKRMLSASGPTNHAAVYLSLARELRADNAALLQRFKQLAPGDVANLMAEGPRQLTHLLLVISASEGSDVMSLAKTWAASDDEYEAQAAIRALAQRDDEPAKAVIETALFHPHYKVRRAALRTLAPAADQRQRRMLLKMASDKSAPVRAALAEVIGKHRWRRGMDTLVQLLDDRRNYAHQPERNQRDEPEFHVARAALKSLGQFSGLSAEVLDRVIQFLARASAQSIDVELHASMLGLLTNAKHPRIWETLELCLNDHHAVGEHDENLYPIRYTAGWAIVNRLEQFPLEQNLVPWSAVRAAADHADPQLAAPALLAVGKKLATAVDANALEALRGANTSDVRKALALLMIDNRKAAQALSTKYGLLPENHPLFDESGDISVQDTLLPRWAISVKTHDWLKSLLIQMDVETVLQWVIKGRTGLSFGDINFDPLKLRRKGRIPHITFAEMGGME